MRFYCMIILGILTSLLCHAQQDVIDKASFCCLYTHFVQTEDREHAAAVDSFYSILEVGDSVYRYGDLSTYISQKKFIPNAMRALEIEDCLRDEHLWVTHNYPEEGEMTVEEALHPAFFHYTESMDSLQWELLAGDSTIIKYTCKKARMQYAGREWLAWYTEEIPISSGPWKLTGLPGLVLFARDNTGRHTFQANSVFKVDNQAVIKRNSEWYTSKETKRDEFVRTRNKIKGDSKWLFTPYYNDPSNVNMAILNAESRKRLGIRPFITVNWIKYPCRELGDGDLDYIYNCFQPLELY